MFKFQGSSTATKADAHIASLTDLKQVTQRSSIGSAAGSVSEGHSGEIAMNSPIQINGKKPTFAPHQVFIVSNNIHPGAILQPSVADHVDLMEFGCGVAMWRRSFEKITEKLGPLLVK